MVRRLLFITHGEVEIDPAVPVPDWGLSATGRARHEVFSASSYVRGITSVYSSAEKKARDGAEILCAQVDAPHHVVEALHENDRSATGFLPKEEFERTADAFFANPTESIRGWERAVDAQSRVIAALRQIAEVAPEGDIAVVAHGGVGALTLCHVMGVAIARKWDQPGGGGGNVIAIDLADWSLIHGWQPIETVDTEVNQLPVG